MSHKRIQFICIKISKHTDGPSTFEFKERFFDSLNILLFVISLSDYDQVCYDSDTSQRIDDSLRLFKNMVNGDRFNKTPVIIIFNKADIFKKN